MNKLPKVHIFGMGFVGKAIAKRLSTKKEVRVICYSRNELDFAVANKKASIVKIDSNDRIVFSAAKAPSRNIEDMQYNLSIINGFINIFEKYDFDYLLNISSDAVYPDTLRKISEELPPSPSTIHGMTHLSRELILDKTFSGRVGHLRPTLIYGHGDSHNSYGPNKFIREALDGLPITINGDGEELRDHISIYDVSRISEFMISNSYTGYLNAATGVVATFHEIATHIASIVSGTSIKKIPRTVPLPHNGFRAFDIAKLDSLELSRGTVNLFEGLADMVRQESRSWK